VPVVTGVPAHFPGSVGIPTVKSPIGFGRLARPPAPPDAPMPAAPPVPAPAAPPTPAPPTPVVPEPAPPSCPLLPLVEQPPATASTPIAIFQLNAERMRIASSPPKWSG
jgi:hypothetical protein